MFGYLKDKLKNAVDKFSKEVDEESEVVESQETEAVEEEIAEEPKEKPKKGFFKFWGKKKEEDIEEEIPSETGSIEGEVEAQESEVKEQAIDIEPSPESIEPAEAEKPEVSEKPKSKTKTKKPKVSESEKEKAKGFEEETEVSELKDEPMAKDPEQKEQVSEPVKQENTEEKPEEAKAKETESLQDEIPVETEKKGFFGKVRSSVVDVVTKSAISEEKFNELFWDIELVLLENNVAVEVIEKIKQDLRENLVNTKVRRGKTLDIIINTLNDSIHDLFRMEKIDIEKRAQEKKPYIITFVGINGSGKTTTIAKLAHVLKQKGYKSVVAAADTFRAAAIQQLEEHTDNIGVKLIKHDYGADPAAVAFDAIKYANSKKLDFVLIDTAGRLHSNSNLVDEMKKIVRVAKPDLKIFVGESTTGNDCIEQAQKFNEAVGVDGIILAKADVDPKGGAAISVSYVTGKPILYIGTGQDYKDLAEFEPELVVKNLGLAG